MKVDWKKFKDELPKPNKYYFHKHINDGSIGIYMDHGDGVDVDDKFLEEEWAYVPMPEKEFHNVYVYDRLESGDVHVAIIRDCKENEKGEFFLYSSNDIFQVNFCPITGKKAPKQREKND